MGGTRARVPWHLALPHDTTMTTSWTPPHNVPTIHGLPDTRGTPGPRHGLVTAHDRSHADHGPNRARSPLESNTDKKHRTHCILDNSRDREPTAQDGSGSAAWTRQSRLLPGPDSPGDTTEGHGWADPNGTPLRSRLRNQQAVPPRRRRRTRTHQGDGPPTPKESRRNQ